jgi:hypothetical protein
MREGFRAREDFRGCGGELAGRLSCVGAVVAEVAGTSGAAEVVGVVVAADCLLAMVGIDIPSPSSSADDAK